MEQLITVYCFPHHWELWHQGTKLYTAYDPAWLEKRVREFRRQGYTIERIIMPGRSDESIA